MGYNKNSWQNKLALRKVKGWRYLPVENFEISEDSKINHIMFKGESIKKIIIYGDYYITVGEITILPEEIIDETDEYYEKLLKKGKIKFARFNKRGNLEISISSESDFILKVDITSDLPSDKWDFNHEFGFITF